MLTKNQREWIRTGRSRYTKQDTSVKRLKDYKIRETARKMIKDLTWLAGALAPTQHKQIFNAETLTPLTKALSDYASECARREREKDKDKKAIVYDDCLFRMGVEIGNEFLTIAGVLLGEKYRKGVTIRILPSKARIDDLNTIYSALKTAKTKK